MAKTMALLFVLGLFVSCASHHGDRSISSIDEETHQRFAERGYR